MNYISQNLDGLIRSGDFSVYDYRDTREGRVDHQYVLDFKDNGFDIPGSGIAPNASQPSFACDTLVVVSGEKQGWHIFADSTSCISTHKYLSPAGEVK